MMLGYYKYIFSILFFSLAITVHAAEKSFIKTKTKKIFAQKITSDSKGVLTYKVGTAYIKKKPREYLYARIPIPSEIKLGYKSFVAKRYSNASKIFQKAYEKYRFLGWDIFCLRYLADSLSESGRENQAIKELQKIKGFPVDPVKKKYYYEAMKLLATLYIKQANYDEAEKILKSIGEADNTDIFNFVSNSRGDIMASKGRSKDAVLMYMRTIMLSTKENGKKQRSEALSKVIKILKEDNNDRYKDFEETLKSDYPEK